MIIIDYLFCVFVFFPLVIFFWVGYKMPNRGTSNHKTSTDFCQKNNVKWRNDETTFLAFSKNSSHNVKPMSASRLGVIWCSICSQAFTRPFLYYCWSLHVIKMPLTSFSTFFLSMFCDSTLFYCVKKCKMSKTTLFWCLFWRYDIQHLVTFFSAFLLHFIIWCFTCFPFFKLTFVWYLKLLCCQSKMNLCITRYHRKCEVDFKFKMKGQSNNH